MRFGISIAAGLLAALGLPSAAHAEITVQNFWHLGESGGSRPTDAVGGKNFTEQVGTQVVSTAVHAPGSTASLYYNGYGGTYMGGASDFIDVPADNWVFEMWVNPDTFENGFSAAHLGQDDGHAKIGISGSGDVYFARENQSFGPLFSKIVVGAWNHIAYVQMDGKIHGYVNGVAAGAYDNDNASFNNNGALHLGVRPGNSEPFKGYLDEVRFSTFASGAFRTSDLLNAQPVPEPASMVALGAGALALLRRRKMA